jgi:uncharacterized membrane protein YbaN (DUF454 family)
MCHTISSMRLVYFALGWLFFGIALAGVLLPLLPTTPFMLLALWGFAKSSPRFHHWLYHHRLFGPPLQRWQRYGVIPPLAKLIATAFMGAGLVFVSTSVLIPLAGKFVIGLIIGYGMWFIVRKPSRIPHGSISGA